MHCVLNTNKSLIQEVFLIMHFRSHIMRPLAFFVPFTYGKRHVCLPFHKLQLVKLGLSTSCSATLLQLLVFRANFFVSSNFLYSEQFLYCEILEQVLALKLALLRYFSIFW